MNSRNEDIRTEGYNGVSKSVSVHKKGKNFGSFGRAAKMMLKTEENDAPV